MGLTPTCQYYACRDAARCQRLLAANVVRQLIRTKDRYCRRALAAWRHAMQAQQAKRAVLHGAIQRMAVAKARAAFHAWALAARERCARRQRHAVIVKKVAPQLSMPISLQAFHLLSSKLVYLHSSQLSQYLEQD